MSYHIPAARAMVPRRPAMGGLMDMFVDAMQQQGIKIPPVLGGADAIADAETKQCLAKANQLVANLDNRRFDLVKNWNPSGIYTIQQFDSLITATLAMLRSASSTIDRAAQEKISPAHRDQLNIERGAIQRKMATEGLVFIDASRAAKAKGIEYIDSPGLKRWITNSMGVASSAVVAANVVMCLQPWWVQALQVFQATFNALYAVARAIVGVTVSLAKTALKVPDAIATLITYGKWALLAGGAYWLYTKYGTKIASSLRANPAGRFTAKEERMAGHIEESARARGYGPKRAKQIAWGTVQKQRKKRLAKRRRR